MVPFGRFVSVSDNPPFGSIVRLTGPLMLCCGFDASVAWMVMFDVPAVVGVPVTVQLFGVNANPAGRAPTVTEQVYGVVPPVTPTVPV